MGNTLLGEDGAERIRSIARAAVGDSLRSITYFTRTEYDQIYLRNDLERDADLSSFVGHEWQAFQMTQDTYGGSELGGYEYTLRSFENGYLLRVATEREGVFLTADSLTLRDYEEVATALENEIETWRED
ncbi:DUF7522 family protein [Halospeciosus flavus]|uniref:Bacterial Pleckstrin homology domain-containing protein n=1 Tax=Halospeciosus flavus TaxID=3032283 RepID=A0ABD5Z780_9EURY|nr:hypothetical protein [Halospeciosus flavus]